MKTLTRVREAKAITILISGCLLCACATAQTATTSTANGTIAKPLILTAPTVTTSQPVASNTTTSTALISPFGTVTTKDATTTTTSTAPAYPVTGTVIIPTATAPISTAPAPVETISGALTVIKIENTGSADQSYVPVTFGQVFAQGDVPASNTLTGKLSDGTAIPFQVNAKATHPDGSLRHGVISAVLPRLALAQIQTIGLVKVAQGASSQPVATPAALINSGFSAGVSINFGGQIYSASADALLKSGNYTTWLAGPMVNEWLVSAPLKTSAGVAHPHLTARFAVRSYTGLGKARVDVIIENNKTFAAGAQNFTYNVDVLVNGQVVYAKTALTHYHHARWRKIFWWGGAEPAIHIKHNTAYLIATKAVSNYDSSIVVAESALAGLATKLTSDKTGPMTIGLVAPYMPMAGGRPDIAPLPNWSVLYLLSMDKRAKNVMLSIADGAGSWPIHYRDEATDFPVRLDNAINRNISTHGNYANSGPLPVPRCVNNSTTLCVTPMTPDDAHQPSLVYLPYLVTGDHYYLEELQFWAAWNPLGTAPGSHGYEKGLVKWAQLRGQAWSLRTLGHAAYITPDTHYMKSYLIDQLSNNLDFYNAAYTIANPNQLGVYDGSGVGAFVSDSGQSSPWQDDFFTWSTGYLAELGFTKAKPLFVWKAKYPVGRMTAPGYCWIDGAVSVLQIRPGPGLPVYTTFATAYAETKKNANTPQTQTRISNGDPSFNLTTTATYLSQPCNSQAQADWRTTAQNNTSGIWVAGQMTGFASSPSGFPANMQPALAVSATSGIPNAQQAWSVFTSRAKKPNYTSEPQWAIVPRN